MLALSEWQHYLMGAAIDVEIWDRPPEPPILPKASEAEPLTGTMGDGARRVPLCAPTQIRPTQQEG